MGDLNYNPQSIHDFIQNPLYVKIVYPCHFIHNFKLVSTNHRYFTMKGKFDECLKKKDILMRVPKYRYIVQCIQMINNYTF